MKTVKGRVTILTDNVVPGRSEAIGEHGFSTWCLPIVQAWR